MRTLALILTASIAFAGCDSGNMSAFTPEVVVESYLVAGESMPSVRLSWTEDIAVRYDPAARAIIDADVAVRLLTRDGGTEEIIAYEPNYADPGVYRPVVSHRVIPERTYRLEATVPGAEEAISAETTVPGDFEIRGVTADTVVYQGPIRYEVDVTESTTDRDRTIYVFSVEALDPDLANLTPLYLDSIYGIKEGESYDPDSLDFGEIEPFLVNASPPLNEANYQRNPDGTVRVRLPWFGVVFYGRHRVSTSAIDDAIFDFMRYQQVQQGGSTLSPGEIPNVRDHVTGGRGVFGSMATVSAVMVVTRD